jgi:hypothetical protein
MVYQDYIQRDIEVKADCKFILNDFYKKITSWAKKARYDIEEKTYDIVKDGKTQSLKIVLKLEKRISDYSKIGMDLKINCNDIKNTKIKNKIIQEGEVNTSINSYIEKDTEDTWSRKATPRFLREIYDKYIAGSQFDKYENELKDDVKSLRNTIKDFLKAPILKK